jgi:hypothetical protein
MKHTHLWVLFSEILVQDDTEVVHVLLLVALHHHHSDPRDQISSLLTDFRALVVQSPQHSACCCALWAKQIVISLRMMMGAQASVLATKLWSVVATKRVVVLSK